MRIRLFGTALLLILSACHVPPPEFPVNEVPAEPLLRKLSEQRSSFVGMKAVARVTIERAGRTRVYESVAILQQEFRKLKVEAYGPLGEPLVALLWDGSDVLVRKQGEIEPTKVGQFGLERLLGVSVSPASLCALLTGNVPVVTDAARIRAGCDPGGKRCVLEMWNSDDDVGWHVVLVPEAADSDSRLTVSGADLYRGSRLVLRSRFDRLGSSPAGQVPKRVAIEDPGRKVRFVVDYQEAEAGIPVGDSSFTFAPEEEPAR